MSQLFEFQILWRMTPPTKPLRRVFDHFGCFSKHFTNMGHPKCKDILEFWNVSFKGSTHNYPRPFNWCIAGLSSTLRSMLLVYSRHSVSWPWHWVLFNFVISLVDRYICRFFQFFNTHFGMHCLWWARETPFPAPPFLPSHCQFCCD